MKITALVENYSASELIAKHGLSLYIETKNHTILFDLGSDDTLFKNAKMRNIDLSKVDIVIISHGHIDHGGALKKLLEINTTAKIYIQKTAFEPHYLNLFIFKLDVGLNKSVKKHSQIILIDGDYKIDDELELFTISKANTYFYASNNVLYENGSKDKFSHEQNLIIKEDGVALIMGCGHCGIINILEKAEVYTPTICVGGYHFINPITKKIPSTDILDKIAIEFQKYKDIKFYTCHCTGIKAYKFLSKKVPNLFYLKCGECIKS